MAWKTFCKDVATVPLLPFPPFRSRPPYCRYGVWGARFSSPIGSGWSPAAKRHLVNFRLKISHLVATIFRSFSGNETPNWGTGWPSCNILCAIKLLGHHNSLEDVLQVCGNRSSPPLSLPSLALEVCPLIADRASGERFSSPSGSGRSPAAKRYLVNFRLKISPMVATIFRSFSGNERVHWGD